MLKLEKTARKHLKHLRDRYQEFRYYHNDDKAALRALKVIENEKSELPKSLKNQCDEYAVSYLGDIKYAPWLYVYSAIQGEFKYGWIPDSYYNRVMVQGIERNFGAPSNLKPLSNRMLKTNKLPDLLYVIDGVFIEPSNYKIIPANDARSFLFSEDSTVIFKINNSLQGEGVRFYTQEVWSAEAVKGESGVFQRVIKQHDFFNEIFPYPGATIRITTALNDSGKATVRAASIRLGRSTDSSKHIQSKSAVKVAIDIDSGELFSMGYLPDWSSTKLHPDTGVTFEGLIVPAFKDACLDLCHSC